MATSLIRTLILYFLIILSLRIMGKRQLGELQPAELVTSILISDLAAVPMQDLGIPLVQGVVPILTLFSLEVLVSALSARSARFRAFFCGRTSVLIKNGVINQRELKRQRINITELLEELRLKDVFDPSQVGSAYLETNGALSIQLRAAERPVTAGQMQIDTRSEPELYMTLIAQGRVLDVNLAACGHDRAWLLRQIAREGLRSPHDVFLMVLDDLGKTLIVPRTQFPADSGVKEG
ncbi:MAG: DUF421 domain-containing protein [Ruminococcaceae bacterium]|nr:DUF421 domain-containing protein [Oscillospiraceae bacterium]